MRRAASVLVATGVLAVGLYAWNRGRSPFLAAERDLVTARRLAAESGLPLPEVLALREGTGVELGAEPWPRRVERWSAARARWPQRELAVLELLGARALAEDLARQGGAEAGRVRELLRERPEQVGVRRFLAVAERFASRIAPGS